MPYYAWEGVDQYGLIQHGIGFAQSIEKLDSQLFSRHIALLSANPSRSLQIFRTNITAKRAEIYKSIYRLLDAGIMIADAMLILSELTDRSQTKAAVLHIYASIQSGESLYTAFKHSPLRVSTFDLQLIKAGEQSGQLKQAFEGLAYYYEMYGKFKQKLRQVMFIPTISICFFIGLFFIILFVVVPQFVSFFQTLGQPVPLMTHRLLQINTFLKHWAVPICCGVLGAIGMVRKYMPINVRYRTVMDTMYVKLPIIGAIIKERFLVSWAYSLALLCERGIPLSKSLSIILPTIDNTFLENQVRLIDELVKSGYGISHAMMSCDGQLFPPSCFSMISIAEESGTVPTVFHYLARVYSESLSVRLDRLAVITQPILLILLGLGVVMLILAIYGPILSISQVL